MNKWKFIPLLLLLLSACSNELRVYTDFDRSVSIQKLTSYDWLPVNQIEARNNPILLNELTDKRIKKAVEAQLEEKGYVRSETSAQMIIHYHIIVENKASVSTEPYGYNYGHYWLDKELDSYRYNEVTLILDFMDSRNCDLIWRGWAVSILDEEAISEALINQAVAEIFQQFPVSAAKEVTLP
jgi:hypothetical protein